MVHEHGWMNELKCQKQKWNCLGPGSNRVGFWMERPHNETPRFIKGEVARRNARDQSNGHAGSMQPMHER